MKKLLAICLVFLMAFSVTICTGNTTEGTEGSKAFQNGATDSGAGTPIILTIGNTKVSGVLNDSVASREFIAKLPYTITVQKYAHDFCAVMDKSLTYDKTDLHDGWRNGDIDFVPGSDYFALLFNDSDTSSSPHVNLGRMEGDLSFFDAMTGSVVVTVALAGTTDKGENKEEVGGFSSLVVFYSYSGNTKSVALRIADLADADTYEIRTVEDYPSDPHETANVSRRERSSGNLPKLVDDMPDISGYDVIYIGGPIWNGYMSTPLESYLERTDFSGKTVIPFSTSMGSGQSGYQTDFKQRVWHPANIGKYLDIQFPGNRSPDAFTTEELDSKLSDWLVQE